MEKYVAGMNKELDEITEIANNPFTGEQRVRHLANAERDINLGISILNCMKQESSSLGNNSEIPTNKSFKDDITKMKNHIRKGTLNCSVNYKKFLMMIY